MNLSSDPSPSEDLVWATAYCGPEVPLWNASSTMRSSSPNLTDCFQRAVLVPIPCLFFFLVLPFHVVVIRRKNRGYIPVALLNAFKMVALALMLLMILMDFGILLYLQYGLDLFFPPDHFATPAYLYLTLCFAGWLMYYERQKGCQSSGCLWLFWFLLTLVLTVAFRSYILEPQIEPQYGKLRSVIFFIFFSAVVIEFFLHCFAEATPPSLLSDHANPCPESSSSFLSRITFNWFFKMACRGFRKPLQAQDIWDLDPYDRAFNLDQIFRKKWEKFGHYWEVLAKDRVRLKNLAKSETPEKVAFIKKSPTENHEEESKTKNAGGDDDDGVVVVVRNGQTRDDENETGNTNENAKRRPFFSRRAKASDKIDDKKEAKEKNQSSLWSAPRGGKRYLLNTLLIAFGKTFLFAVFFKLIHDLLLFVPPYFLNKLIAYIRAVHDGKVGTSKSEDYQFWHGYFYAALLYVAAIVQTIMLHQYFHRCILTGMWLRSSVIAAIYRKSLNLSSFSRQSTTVGEIVNLMAVDAQKFMEICTYLNMVWSAPLQIAIGIYLLWGLLGPSTLAGIGVMILLMPINGALANFYKVYQIEQMKLKDERIKMVNEVLNGIKVLKLYGWEPSFLRKMSDIRKREVVYIRKMAILNAVSSLLWTCAPNFISLATFYTYVLTNSSKDLDAQKAFVSMSYFNILRFPMSVLPMMISSLVQAYVSLKRINNFLRLEELDRNNVEPTTSVNDSVKIEGGAFQWGVDAPIILDNVDISINRGSLVAVVGPVGCGKSSLVSAILGNMHKTRGRVTRSSSIAFVPQQPWIQNDTLESNVLFHAARVDDQYAKVLWACALEPDLAMLPNGDQTEIGEKGINLSGGQKQRISLARAVYADREVYLLDDPLSAVDSHVGKHIFDHVIGPEGLLSGKTRLLVTHSIAFLDRVDYIYVVNEGVITERGSFVELMAADGKFMEFINLHSKKAGEEDDKVVDSEEKALSSLQMNLLTPKMSNDALSVDGSKTSVPSAVFTTNAEPDVETGKKSPEAQPLSPKQAKSPAVKLIQEEGAEIGNVKMSVVKMYVLAVGTVFAVFGSLFYLIQQAFDVGISFWLADWANENERLKLDPNATATIDLHERLIVYTSLTVIMGIVVVSGSFMVAIGNIRASRKLHDDLAYNILRSPMSFFDTVPQGRILNRFSKDIDTIDSTIPFSIRGFLGTFVRVLGTIIIVCISTPFFLAVCPFLFLFYFFAQRFYIPASRQLKRLESVTRSPIYSHFGESITGVTTIRAYNRQDEFIDKIFELVDSNVACYFPNMVSNRWLAIRLEFVGNSIMFFAALFAVVKAKTIESGTAGLAISAAMQITQTLNWMVRMTSELENNIVSVERIKEYTETPTEAPWKIKGKKPPDEWPRLGNVEFLRLDLRYREGLELVLKGVNISVKDGEKVGIVGRTGAGKSSLTVALFRLVEAAAGEIDIDSVDIAKIGLHDLRTKLSIIPQDPVLFSGSLRMNLDPFDAYSDDAVWEALEHAHLKDYVKGLEEGLGHICSEGGENLSVGQRQLVCLARALLRKSKILVLDEATAAVDLETDRLIQATVRSQFSASTILTIAHRLNTVMDYDKILVMDAGLVAQYDSPQNLLKNQKGIFYGMAKDAHLV